MTTPYEEAVDVAASATLLAGTVADLQNSHDAAVRRAEDAERALAEHMATHEQEPETPALKVLGMSAPARDWDARVREVGGPDGITARRIFCDLADGPRDQETTIRRAVTDGMMPVVSYKVGGDITGALSGRFDAAAEQAAAFLDSLGAEVAVTIWHEPNGDITGAQLVALHRRLLPPFKRGKIKVGPCLNGWQLTGSATERARFRTYTSQDLIDDVYDYFGIDTYQNPDKLTMNPGDRIDPLVKMLAEEYDAPAMPLMVGEYNCHTAADVAEAGDKFLSTPTMWCFIMWNANGTGAAKATVLVGDRREAFKRTKADPRVAR